MNIRSLFQIILKILGIFFIKDILATIPQVFSVGYYFTLSDSFGEATWTLLTVLLTLSAYALVSYFLIFRSDFVIDKLRLDKGFDDETIPLAIHRSAILSISIIVIGGWMVADEVPNFCRQLFSYFQQRRLSYGQTDPTISYAVLSASKVIIGLLLMGNQRQIVNYIEHRRRK